MPIICPKCDSERIHTRNRARKAGGAVGTLAGATTGAAGLFQGARYGWAAAASIAPMGMPYTRIAGAIIGGIVGATTGCAIGVSLGELVDDNVLDNHKCLTCGYTFSPSRVKKTSSLTPEQSGMFEFPDDDGLQPV